MRVITNAELKAAINKAIENNKLAAMHGRRGHLVERLDDGTDCYCAIGTVLSPADIPHLRGVNGPNGLRERGIMEFDAAYAVLDELMVQHDRWGSAVQSWGTDDRTAALAKKDFMKAVEAL